MDRPVLRHGAFTTVLMVLLGACATSPKGGPELPLEEELVEEMRCEAPPIPGDYFGMLEVQRRIDPKTITHEAGLACAAIPGGLALKGMRFDRICGYEMDPDRRRRATYFRKSASPQHLRLETDAPEAELLRWSKRHLRPARGTQVSPRLDGAAGSAVACTTSAPR